MVKFLEISRSGGGGEGGVIKSVFSPNSVGGGGLRRFSNVPKFYCFLINNPGTSVGPGFCDQMLAVTSPPLFFRYSEGTFSKQLFEATKFHIIKYLKKKVLGSKNSI